MASFINNCRFTPTAGGTSDWTYSAAISGSVSPTAAGAKNGALYRYAAYSADLSQWEIGYGAYTSSTGVFARTTVVLNSSGDTSKINFSAAPTVSIVPLAEDFREKLDADRTYYIGVSLGAPAISIASPAVATLTAHGLSANDPVVFNVPLNTTVCTISAANPAVVTMTNTFSAGQPVVFSSTGYLPTNIVAGTTYYVISTGLSGSSFQISATVGGAAINTTATTATFTNGSDTITAGATENLVVGQIIRFAGTSVVNFSNATDYYVTAVPTGTTFKVSATNGGTAITAGAVTSNGTLVQAGTHYCSTTGALPTGVTEGTTYYVLSTDLAANTFKFSTSVGGAAVNTSGSVTGSPVYNVYTGNDNNSGLSATRTGALLTINRFCAIVGGLDFSIYNVTGQVCNGAFAETVTLKNFVGAGACTLQGNSTTPSNCILTSASGDAIGGTGVQGWGIKWFRIVATTGQCVAARSNSTISISGVMEFGSAGNYHIYLSTNSRISCASDYTISGAAVVHVRCENASYFQISSGKTVTLTGIPAFSTGAYIYLDRTSTAIHYGTTFVGSATSARFYTANGSLLYTNGGGPNYFPGSSAGTGTNYGASPYGMYA